ncbi:MAG: hypothetical protein A3J37_05890 [Alphaproteobacteria bacterium RIFCSPHIGHO2_12_FULL_45_9]|nr:MAG: hypothetical protein A3J37_05890 [Alphaproteobacteria bacterium RIFCSPHIGHO2_12_FULL_45_9]
MTTQRIKERGSILVYILLGVVLLGLLTIALRNAGTGGVSDIDKEQMILKAGQAQKDAAELAAAVNDLIANGVSEADLRFAHPDAPTEYGNITDNPTNQVFGKQGGKAAYKSPPEGINDGSPWEFFGSSQIIQVGSDRSELIAVLPNVTESFCKGMDAQLGFDPTLQPTDNSTGSSPDCVMGTSSDRFTGTFSDASPNVLDKATFSKLPALQACVYCAADSTYNYYYVLLAR